jgi:hypothetical protein
MKDSLIATISNITLELPKHLLQQLMESRCVTWHPSFEVRHCDRIMSTVHTQVPFENLTEDNKWGYQTYISRDLEKIQVDYTDIISVKNMIVMDHFMVSFDNNKYYYSNIYSQSIQGIFLEYCDKYEKDEDEWDHTNIKELKQLNTERKKDDSQYNFFSINERELGYFVNAILHLVAN